MSSMRKKRRLTNAKARENQNEDGYYSFSKKNVRHNKKQSINRLEVFSNVNKLKDTIINHFNNNNFNKANQNLKYLQENQTDKAFLVKSLSDIAVKVHSNKAKLITLKLSYSINDTDIKTLTSYATALSSDGSYKKAFDLFEQSLSIDGNNTVTLNSYATALSSDGSYEKAFDLFEQSLSIDGNNTVTLTSYATALSSDGNYKKAFDLFEQSLSIDGNNTVTLTSYATALSSDGNYKKAFDLFEQSLSIDGNDTVTLNSYATALSSDGNYKKAFDLFEQSLSIDGNNTVTLNSYATALSSDGNYKKAFDLFEQSLSIDGNDTVTLTSYATALSSDGNYKKAFDLFEQSLSIDDSNIIALFSFGIFLQNNNKYPESIDVFLKILENNKLKSYQKDFSYLTLAVLYLHNNQNVISKKYFDLLLESSQNIDKTRMKSALIIFKKDPYSKQGIEELLEIIDKEGSKLLKQALGLLSISVKQKEFYKYFNPKMKDNNTIKTTLELNKAIYHKIDNQINILRSLFELEILNEKDNNILNSLKDIRDNVLEIFTIVKDNKNKEKESIEIETNNYDNLLNSISIVAHNITDKINNKIFTIKSKLNLLKTSKFVEINNQIKTTIATLNNFKDLKQGSIMPKFDKFDLSQLLTNLKHNMKLNNALIQLNISKGEFTSDKQKITECINELIENSTRHNIDKKEINIHIDIEIVKDPTILMEKKEGDYLKIVYQDNGKGIEKDKKKWVFNPLNTTIKNGSGLGLFIIKRIIEKLNGRIYEDGTNGVKFMMFIPNFKKG